MDDIDLIRRYRFPRQTILELTDLVRPDIERQTKRSHPLPVHLQVMVTLRFLAKDYYLSEAGDIHGISTASASRCVEAVCTSLNRRLDNIQFPTSVNDVRRTKDEFYIIAQFPNVIGAIDGTLIPIQGMAVNDYAYICRKGYHALNIQAVVDANMRFTNLVCRYPGASHDAFVLANSGLPAVIATIPEDRHLLGDSGYPLKKWLMTPVLRPTTQQEIRYNRSQIKTRNIVERAFGVVKARFRCIHKTGGSLPYRPQKCAKIIESAFRLHNKAIDQNLPLPQGHDQVIIIHNNDVVRQQEERGADTRRDLINNRF